MKDAKGYERKFKKFLLQQPAVPAPKAKTDGAAEEAPLRVLIESILQADASDKRAAAAMTVIEEEFVDFNELRAAPAKDIVDCVGRDLPGIRTKAEILITVLNGIFNKQSELVLDYMNKMTKKDLRRHLGELGMDAYSAARLTMLCFAGHAMPVDSSLVEVLQMNDLAAPDATVDEVQKFLERIVPQKSGPGVYRQLRAFVEKNAKALEKKRQEEAEAREKIEAQARAKAEAEARVKAEAEAAKAAAEAARQAKIAAKLAEKDAKVKAKSDEKSAREAARAKAARTAGRSGAKERKKK